MGEIISRDIQKDWEDVEVHKISFGHLPDEKCNSTHPLECNRVETKCDYNLSPKCRKVGDIKHPVCVKGVKVMKYACLPCDMYFDEE